MFVVGPQPLVSQIGKLVITWMIQTTPYGRRKKGPWSVLNRDSETKAVLYFTIISFINIDHVVQTLSQGRCFPDQQGRRWQRSRQRRGKEHSSTSNTAQQKVSSILSMIYHSDPSWSVSMIDHYCDHHNLWWSIMMVLGHLSAFQVLEPFQSSYLGLPALDFV